VTSPSAGAPSGPTGTGASLRRFLTSNKVKLSIDLAIVIAFVAVIIVGIVSGGHQNPSLTPIVEASGGSFTTSAPTTTSVVPTTLPVPTTQPPTPTTVPVAVPQVTLPPTTVPLTVPPTVPVTAPRVSPPPPTTTTTTTTPAPPQSLYTQSNEGSEITPQFTVPLNAAEWDVQWLFNCSPNGGGGTFVVNVLDGYGYDTTDVAINQSGPSGTGTQQYHDHGNFSFQISSGCAWSIQVVIP
jgi:hypothetical protein